MEQLQQQKEANTLTTDQLHALRQEFEKLALDREKIESERAFLSSQVDALVKEKPLTW